jgi:hypothetical protein
MTTPTLASPGFASRSTRGVVWVVLVVSLLVALAIAVASAVSIFDSASTGRLHTVLEAGHALPGPADQGPAQLVEGSYESASVVVAGLPVAIVVLGCVAAAIGALTAISLAVAVAAIAWRMLRPEPFAHRLSLIVTVVGGIVLIGSLLSSGIGVMVAWMTAEQLNDPAAGLDGFWPTMATLDPGPLGLGFGLMLVGLAFEYSERLQRDTAGLV